nr:DNA helicase [Tanacetum cinerariifolium]
THQYVSPELPLEDVDPECYSIVSEFMMHGPCGLACPSASWTDRVIARISTNGTKVSEPGASTTNYRPQVVVDEIKNYLDARYISPHEACWRIFEFDIYYREPAVQILSVHLMNMQRVAFRDQDRLDSIVVDTHKKKTTLTEWRHYNEWNTDGRHLTYLDFPSEFVWYADGKYWRRRRVRTKSSIGRLTYVHPAAGDLFYQRMLLCHQKGCKSFPGIRTVNDVVYPTCQAACEALGLFENDREWEIRLEEAAIIATPAELRTLLAHILTFCQVSDPNFGLRMPPERLMSVLKNKLLMEEKKYDRTLLAAHRDQLLPQLNDKHRHIFSLIMDACFNNSNLHDIDMERVSIFAQWLLDIKNGNIGTPDECDPENYSWVDIPEHYCIHDDGNGISNLINIIYDNETLHCPSAMKLQDKAIVCPKNDTTDIINNKILSLLPGRAYTYLSYDEAIPYGHDGGEVELLYPREYLNTLSFPGLPPHRLELKIDTPIMLLRNINIVGGLCNGTRLIVTQLLPKMIEAQIITGTRVSQKVFLPCIPFTARNPRVPFIFKRKQFPVKACYAMTINKSQDQWQQLAFPKAHQKKREKCYNELAARADVKNAILIDYIGRIQAVSRIHTSGDATLNRIHRRIIDIQNLSGNTISIALCHDMAVNFNLQEYEALGRPVVIADYNCPVHLLLTTTSTPTYQKPSISNKYTNNYQSLKSSSRRRDLVLDRVFETRILPLPTSPLQVIPLEPIVEEQSRASQVPEPTAAPISEHQSEANPTR